jgi:hypothetical protein
MEFRRDPMALLRRMATRIPLLLIAATLAACGGGGGDDPPPDPNLPGRPTMVFAVAGNGQATVTFTAPASSGGGAITGYTVKSLPSGGTDSNAGSTSLTHVVTGLTNGTVYIFTVSATNSFGTGAASVSSNSVLPNIPTVPDAPTIGTALRGDGQILVAFTAPTSAGSAVITSYTATCGSVSGTGTASPVAVTNLVNGSAYTCTVVATNSVGNSVASAASNSVTPTPAPPVGALNDTGQVACYNGLSFSLCASANSGDTTTRPRQDGRFGRDAMAAATLLSKRGGGPSGFDFTKMCMSGQLAGNGICPVNPPSPLDPATPTANLWACTIDHHTGLLWSMQTSIDSWANATAALPAAANAASRCGLNTGWRLPTRRELLNIVYNGALGPSIATGYFTGAPLAATAQYWSNDSDMGTTGNAWVVSFNNGSTASMDKLAASGFAVRLVNGAVTPSAVLTINSNGTATDATTGLTWDRCSIGQTLDAGSCTGTVTQSPWTAALAAAVTANTASYKGFTDWRLPSKNELESLVDITRATAPVIDTTVFPNTPATGGWWSSTPYFGLGSAWFVRFDSPLATFNSMGVAKGVRLVRGGAAADSYDSQAP